YDATRDGLLRGRSSMLALVAAQLKEQLRLAGTNNAPIWIDLGGGTGRNIEEMNKHFPINKFERVYLVDLCPSLCRIARERFQKIGWTNVVVLCEDALNSNFPGLDSPHSKIDVITMSYSLSMMDNYYPVVDHVYSLLEPERGILGVADFYSSTNVLKKGAHGVEGYQCNWFTRNFWTIWFAFDHVHLHASRREYLEYRFNIKKVINGRNHFLVPFVVQIPFYIWIGERKKDLVTKPTTTATAAVRATSSQVQLDCASSTTSEADLDAVVQETEELQFEMTDIRPRSMSTDSNSSLEDSIPGSPTSIGSTSTLIGASHALMSASKTFSHPLTTTNTNTIISKADERFGTNISKWRKSYDPTLACHIQFRSYIYAFTWEDPRIDLEVLNLQKDDVMFVITSAGDNALEYALKGQPKRIHCVDMNPCQNHLLELKLASIERLSHNDFWQMFGEGQHPEFRRVLMDQLSPGLSSAALQFWYKNRSTFDTSFYETGYSGLALRLFKWLVRIKGLASAVEEITTADDVEVQERLWETVVKPSTLPEWLVQRVLSHPAFLWNALGVPINQMKMILDEGNAVEYIYDTLDPIMNRSLFKNDQYFYNLVVNRKYTPESCPSYLTEEGFKDLKEKRATDAMVLHTKSIIEVLRGMRDGELSKAVLMDHMDWFGPADAEDEIREVARAVRRGGMVLWRSAGRKPWYNALFEKHGFEVEAVGVRVPGSRVSIDRVNMYASCYKAIRK
ncbi:hypothetical protein BGZ94_001334, partial [Podila epigama]